MIQHRYQIQRAIPAKKDSYYHIPENKLLGYVDYIWFPEDGYPITIQHRFRENDITIFGAMSVKISGSLFWFAEKQIPIIVNSNGYLLFPEELKNKIAKEAYKKIQERLQYANTGDQDEQELQGNSS